MKPLTRREILKFSAVGALAAAQTGCEDDSEFSPGPAGNSVVSILRAPSYSADLVSRMLEGAKQCGLDARGKRVLLKPNLVEFDPQTVINTNVAVVAAAIEMFERLGAAEIIVGEGPGHRRDTYDLAEVAGYREGIPQFERRFVDLNRDDVSAVKKFADEPEFFFPNTVLGADLIVSLAKMKTHHWAGATLSMKNFFGVVPGAIYGWPKNKLHTIGIPHSIAALRRTFPRSFAIVDGIVGMEGNGPIQGSPKQAGVLVMGGDLVAVDATCCRIMGIDPPKLEYMVLTAETGHVFENRIEQRGEKIAAVRTNFKLGDLFGHVRLA